MAQQLYCRTVLAFETQLSGLPALTLAVANRHYQDSYAHEGTDGATNAYYEAYTESGTKVACRESGREHRANDSSREPQAEDRWQHDRWHADGAPNREQGYSPQGFSGSIPAARHLASA